MNIIISEFTTNVVLDDTFITDKRHDTPQTYRFELNEPTINDVHNLLFLHANLRTALNFIDDNIILGEFSLNGVPMVGLINNSLNVVDVYPENEALRNATAERGYGWVHLVKEYKEV